MREILFRGKTEEGIWFEGDFCKPCNIVFERLGFDEVTKQENVSIIEDFKVISETIGQYTGLTDKNGKKIFEGDIVAIDHTLRTYSWDEIPETYKPRRSYSVYWDEEKDVLNYKRNYSVEWKEKDARWILRNGSDQHNLKDTFIRFHNGIIIGNIHDNPEPLKGANDNA